MLRGLFASLTRKPLRVWFHDAYRLPMAGTEGSTAMDMRRAQFALAYLRTCGAVVAAQVMRPEPVSYADLQRVHTLDWLEALTQPLTLAHVFAIDEADVVVDELLGSVRLACGGTLEAARRALAERTPMLNLLGGFHHAAPSRGVGFCALNDVAVAVTTLRSEGFEGQVAVLDLDAHPPDGTAACLRGDRRTWLGSIAGVSWGELPGVDDVVLPQGASDSQVLQALEALLARMPESELTFVLAGGDVVQGDRLGALGMTVAGVRKRDLLVARKLRGTPSVWLPAGGYGPHAWKVLAGTGLALAMDTEAEIPESFDPLTQQMAEVASTLTGEELSGELSLSEEDFPELFGKKASQRLLGFYTREGIELALERYGLLPLIRRLGFEGLKIEVTDRRMRLLCRGEVLVEVEVERKWLDDAEVLFVNWLSLRNPRAQFSAKRPKLPGQEVPGLGLAQEATTLLALMAERLGLEGVAFQPSWFHMAYAGRRSTRFLDARRQGRFEALVRDLKSLSLLDATHAVADGRVLLHGTPYAWEAAPMVRWLRPGAHPLDEPAVAAERERCHFDVQSPAPSAPVA